MDNRSKNLEVSHGENYNSHGLQREGVMNFIIAVMFGLVTLYIPTCGAKLATKAGTCAVGVLCTGIFLFLAWHSSDTNEAGATPRPIRVQVYSSGYRTGPAVRIRD